MSRFGAWFREDTSDDAGRFQKEGTVMPGISEYYVGDRDRRKDGGLMNGIALKQIEGMIRDNQSLMRKDFWRACFLGLCSVMMVGGGMLYFQARTDENQTSRIFALEQGAASATSDRYRASDAARDFMAVNDRIARNEERIMEVKDYFKAHAREHPPASMRGITP